MEAAKKNTVNTETRGQVRSSGDVTLKQWAGPDDTHITVQIMHDDPDTWKLLKRAWMGAGLASPSKK